MFKKRSSARKKGQVHAFKQRSESVHKFPSTNSNPPSDGDDRWSDPGLSDDDTAMEEAAVVLNCPPSFRDAPGGERASLFAKKFSFCRHDPERNEVKYIERMDTLGELVLALKEGDRLTPVACKTAVVMFSSNAFRPLPPRRFRVGDGNDLTEAVHCPDPQWPYLALVYKVFAAVIEARGFSAHVEKNVLDGQFVRQLTQNFDSEDERERQAVFAVLSALNEHFVNVRLLLRDAVHACLDSYTCDTPWHSGIADLLALYHSILPSLPAPFHGRARWTMVRTLPALTRSHYYTMFASAHATLVPAVIAKDPSLAEEMLQNILRSWPVPSQSQVLTLKLLCRTFARVSADALSSGLMTRVAHQLRRSVESPHSQVAEQALALWCEEEVLPVLRAHGPLIIEHVAPALHRNATVPHWNESVRNMTSRALRWMMNTNMEALDAVLAHYDEEETARVAARQAREEQWLTLGSRVM